MLKSELIEILNEREWDVEVVGLDSVEWDEGLFRIWVNESNLDYDEGYDDGRENGYELGYEKAQKEAYAWVEKCLNLK
jgi:hypothetical protein